MEGNGETGISLEEEEIGRGALIPSGVLVPEAERLGKKRVFSVRDEGWNQKQNVC